MLLSPEKILLIKFRSLGDTVLLTAPLQEIHRIFPKAEIHLAVMESWSPLLENFPGVKKIWKYHRSRNKLLRAKELLKFVPPLKKEKFDTVICFHASPSSALLSLLTKAKVRSVHFHGHQNSNRFSTVQIPGKGTLKPIIERDMDGVRALGLEIQKGILPKIFLKEEERKTAQSWLSDSHLPHPVLALGMGASRPTKTWPLVRFAELAVRWSHETGGSVISILGPEDQIKSDLFRKTVDHLFLQKDDRSRIICQTDLSLRSLAALLSHVDVFLGNDSGPKHLAAAVHCPTVTLFGPEDPFEWHPYPREQHPYFFIEGLSCRKDAMPGLPPWCGLYDCTKEAHKCMKQISVEEVMKACLKVARST